MGLVGEIVGLANQIYNIWIEQKRNRSIDPKELFLNFIEPSYLLLKEVHSDYLEMYLELQERIELEETLTRATVKWFGKVRASRQVDRSELQLLQVPIEIVKPRSRKRSELLEEAVEEYFESMHSYFLPAEDLNTDGNRDWFSSESHILIAHSTRSQHTQQRLYDMYLWLELPHEEKLALLADERLPILIKKLSGVYPRDEFIYGIIEVALLEDSRLLDELERLISNRAKTAKERIIKLESSEGSLPDSKLMKIKAKAHAIEKYPVWRMIIQEHINGELSNIERAIRKVQRSYIKLRLLTYR